jgi:hypothetical protein
VHRLRAAAHRRERLDGHPDDVVLGLLGGEVEPPVCAWNRNASAFSFVTPSRSRRSFAHSRRAARNFATSWKKSLCALKKNDNRSPKASGSSPASCAALQ